MSAMTTFPVKYHPLLEQRPDLLEAARGGAAYFESLYLTGPEAGSPEPLVMNWQFLPGGTRGGEVSVGFSERYESDQKGIVYSFPAKQLLDPVSRETHMLRLWRRVLISRDHHIGQRMSDALNELARLENQDGE